MISLRKYGSLFLSTRMKSLSDLSNGKAMIETQMSKPIKRKRLRTNNGFEFCGGPFNEFCKNEGIVHYHTVRHTP